MNNRNNRIINDIMSNPSSSIMVISSSDCMNTVFLSELSNRYSSTFWFDAKQDNIYSLSLDLAEKMMPNDKETYNKFVQLKYCENPGVDKIILNVIFNSINEKQGDCLLIMEHIEKINTSFNYQLIEYMLMNCPKNLKIILISEEILPLDYNKLGKFAPKVLDEFILMEDGDLENNELKLNDLSKEDICFLSYISDLYSVTSEFVKSIYQNATAVLDYIAVRNEGYVERKGHNKYGISRLLKKVLIEKNIYDTGEFTENIFNKLFDYLIEKGKYINATKVSIKLRNPDLFSKVIRIMVKDNNYLINMYSFARSDAIDKMEEFITTNNCTIYGYSSIFDLHRKKYDSCLKKTNELLEIKDYKNQNEYLVLAYVKMRALERTKGANAAIDFLRELLPDDYSFDSIRVYESIIVYIPKLFQDSDYECNRKALKKCVQFLDTNQLPFNQLYIKALQSIAEACFDVENCGLAKRYLEKIYDKVEFYVLPYKFLQYYYYAGDMKMAEMEAKRALENAKKYGEYRNISYIYCLLAKVYSYIGHKKDAIKYADMAIESKNCGEAAKYYSIWTRTVIYADNSKEEYPKEIALIYAKMCELKDSKYLISLYCGISYWYWQNGQKEEAKHYASKCLLKTKNHTLMWVFSSSVLINYAISANDTKGLTEYLEIFLNTCERNGLDTIFIDYNKFFVPILKYSKDNKICENYVVEILNKQKQVIENMNEVNKELKIKIFNDSSISIDGKEIQWKTKKSRELFMLYLFRGKTGIERSQIFSLLWGEYIYESAINNLKTTNNIIRKTLNQYDIKFKLEYKNAKYTLYLQQYQFDYDQYLGYLNNFENTDSIADKITIMLDVINLYGTGFAQEYSNGEFLKVRLEIKNELSIKLVEFIKLLRENHRYIDAKKFINALYKIDENNYRDMIKGLE